VPALVPIFDLDGTLLDTDAALVAPFLALVHLRDAKPIPGRRFWQPVLAGRGEVRFDCVVGELRAIGYEGYVSFEWEKYWHPELEEPEIAFADFRRALDRLAVAA